MMPQLNRLFGEHTFFLDDTGLLIVEPTDSDVQEGMVVKLASWKDESHMSLAPHGPEVTDMVVVLDDAARSLSCDPRLGARKLANSVA